MAYQTNYAVTITGETDLLFHKDNIIYGAKIKAWQKAPGNKKFSVAGDDRTPAWSWLSCLYDYAGKVVIDADMVMSTLREGGKKCPAPTGRGSMKSQTQSGILCNELGWPLVLDGNTISYSDIISELSKEALDFEVHTETVKRWGFSLDVRRARVGKNKHIRVRPRFPAGWVASGTLSVIDPQIDKDMLITILQTAGDKCGLGDWRPGSPTPGQFGRFSVSVVKI